MGSLRSSIPRNLRFEELEEINKNLRMLLIPHDRREIVTEIVINSPRPRTEKNIDNTPPLFCWQVGPQVISGIRLLTLRSLIYAIRCRTTPLISIFAPNSTSTPTPRREGVEFRISFLFHSIFPDFCKLCFMQSKRTFLTERLVPPLE